MVALKLPTTPKHEPDCASHASERQKRNVLRMLGTLGTCACRKSNSNILVMQPAQDWKAKNTPCPLNRAR